LEKMKILKDYYDFGKNENFERLLRFWKK